MRLMSRSCCERLPSIDLARHDLTGSTRRPEQRGGCIRWHLDTPVGRKIAVGAAPWAGSLTILRSALPLRWRSVGEDGVSRSDLGYFGCLQVESAVDSRESLPTAATIGAAAQVPSAAPPQRRPAFLDLREPVVRQLARFASNCEARDDVTAASTGLARLLVLVITAWATEYRSLSHSSVTSGSHPADDD